MTTGHTSKAALGAARIALLAGVSAAAIFAANTANAQTTSTFDNGGQYATNGRPPLDTDLVQQAQMLWPWCYSRPTGAEALGNGYRASAGHRRTAALRAQWTAGDDTIPELARGLHQLIARRIPLVTCMFITLASRSEGQIVPSTETYNARYNDGGRYRIRSDPNLSYTWAAANYGTAVAQMPTLATGAPIVGGQLLLNTNGTVLTVGQATALGLAPTGTSTLAAALIIAPTALQTTSVAAGTPLPNNSAVAGLGLYNFNTNGVMATPTASGNYTVTATGGGGVVYGNSQSGSTTAIGPDGITGTGWTLTVQNPAHTSSTVIHDGSITSFEASGPNAGSTNIDGANTRISGPAGGTFGTQTTDGGANGVFVGLANGAGVVAIANTATGASNVSTANGTLVTVPGAGVVSIGGVAGGTIGVGVATATGSAGVGTSTPGGPTGLLVSNSVGTAQFTANSSGYISAEGNRVQDVAAPIAGTDATNKAYVDKGLNKAYEGTAIALAISQPVFLPGQTFAMRAGWGDYEGQNAFGVSVAGVVAHNVFGYGSTVSLDGGIGAGNSSVAGKAGVTVGFGGGSAPLK